MNSVKVGLLTIGQSPREDIIPEIKSLFLPHIEIAEKGLLDNFTPEEIEHLKPERGDTPLVSRLKEGREVKLSEKKISSLLPEVIDSMKTKMDVRAVGVLCTHDFPKTQYSFPVIFPFNYLYISITQILHVHSLGIVVPLENQIEMTKKKWEKEKVVVEVKSPYTEGKSWEEISQKFIQENIEAVILDCIGYSIKDKQKMQENLLAPTILLPRVILTSAINQLFTKKLNRSQS